MVQRHRTGLALLFILIIQLTLLSRAMGSTMYFHSFSFDAITDAKKYGKPDIEVLDYAYGSSHQFGTHPSKSAREMSPFFYEQSISGPMPRGDYLYVKWRVKETGKVYEEKVDLTHRLPADITNFGLHFVIDGPQLYVFLIPPPGVWNRDIYYKEADAEFRRKHQIYPESAK